MKNTLIFTFISFICLLLVQSCTVESRYHRRGFNLSSFKHDKIRVETRNTYSEKEIYELISDNLQTSCDNSINSIPVDNKVINNDKYYESHSQLNNSLQSVNFEKSKDNTNTLTRQKIELYEKFSLNNQNFKKTLPLENCDIILLKNGVEIQAKVIEIGTTEIKYKKCDHQDGPTISILKNSIFMITYSNGSKEVINEIQNTNVKVNNNGKEINGFAIASFMFGLLGFIPLVGVILGAIGLSRINSEPERFIGKTFAIVGMLLSFLWLAILAVYLGGY